MFGRKHPLPIEPEPPAANAEPDQAWKALALVNDWIKHAESKTGVTLAVTGVTGVTLYNLVKNQTDPSDWVWLSAALCGAFALMAGICSALALLPRMRTSWRREDPNNPLFFSHVARRYKKDAPTYVEVLHALTSNRDDLTRHIAHQVHANSTVAHRKYAWANRAVAFLILDLVALSALAMLLGQGK